jgi:hypothetical protein
MATYEITAPDGRKFRVSGNGSREEALAHVQSSYQQQAPQPYSGPMARPKAQPTAPTQGFVGPTQEQANKPRINPQMASPLDAIKGVADVAISGARSLVNKPSATLMGLVGGVNPNDTYMAARDRQQQAIATDQGLVRDSRLRTPQGHIVADKLGNLPGVRQLGQAVNWAGQKIEDVAGPEARDFIESATMFGTLGRAPKVAGATRTPLTAESVVARSARGDSAGAAAAATDVSSISPELRQAIVQQGGQRSQVSPSVLSRHVEADSLPVPIRLTAGEATGDPILLSQERNLRGKHPEMVQRMDETNKALGQNMQALRDQVGERVFTTNQVEHGDTLIAAYRAKDAAAEANINALYKQVRDSLGGRVPIDAGAILKNSVAALHKDLKYDYAPPEIMRTLARLADAKNMTFENFESLRSNLAAIQRSGADGNVKRAASIIRTELENLPIFPGSGAERMKPLADAARAAARRRFQELEADPAYEAAVNGTVPADNFVRKFVIGAPRDQLAATMRNLADQRETVSVAVLDYLRDAAKLDPGYNGNFSTAGFSRALEGLNPKAALVFDPQTVDTLGKLRNVAGYTTAQPRGSFVNNSNTLVGNLATGAGQMAEGVINYGTLGFGAPLGKYVGRKISDAPSRRLIRNSLQTGAGLVPPKNSLARSTPKGQLKP